MYKIGDIFNLDNEYPNRAKFCNENNLVIVEIKNDENGRRFQIQEIPPLSGQELANIKIVELKQCLVRYKEDVEQVELFGMTRDDYEIKKERCKEIILELRKLETQK